jgi:hypothetical protein
MSKLALLILAAMVLVTPAMAGSTTQRGAPTTRTAGPEFPSAPPVPLKFPTSLEEGLKAEGIKEAVAGGFIQIRGATPPASQ